MSDADLEICLAVLRSLTTEDRVAKPEYKDRRYRALRVALQPFLDDLNGNNIADARLQKQQQRILRAQAQKDFEHDRKAAEKTRMWAERVRMRDELERSLEGAPLRIADGAVADREMLPVGGPAARLSLSEAAAASTPTQTAQASESAQSPESEAEAAAANLVKPAACYICKERFRTMHTFYSKLCPACAELNFRKRSQTAPMTGRVVLITGARVKIGFQVCLKLLRCGSTVIATTRFPVDACRRFAAQPDFEKWRGNLRVYGIDLRDVRALDQLCTHLVETLPRLDAIINNACQTIRRPEEYYMPLLQAEVDRHSHGPEISMLLSGDEECFRGRVTLALPPPELTDSTPSESEAACASDATASKSDATAGSEAQIGSGVSLQTEEPRDDVTLLSEEPQAMPFHSSDQAPAPQPVGGARACASVSVVSAAQASSRRSGGSQAARDLTRDTALDGELFPAGEKDVEGQQLDLRRVNSWLLRLPEVSTSEAAEVLAINTLAPFTINSRLHPLLARSPEAHRFVVNVSAMEGKFNRYKTPNHPHTNMAKAALNMMTRTCAEDLAKSGIYMNSVDTGWINDENPLEKARAIAEKHHFQTPLDEIDAAARILDPIFDVVNGAEPVHGKFIKDYASTTW